MTQQQYPKKQKAVSGVHQTSKNEGSTIKTSESVVSIEVTEFTVSVIGSTASLFSESLDIFFCQNSPRVLLSPSHTSSAAFRTTFIVWSKSGKRSNLPPQGSPK